MKTNKTLQLKINDEVSPDPQKFGNVETKNNIKLGLSYRSYENEQDTTQRNQRKSVTRPLEMWKCGN